MRVVTEFPRQVREIEQTWIPLSDGTHLAARIWLPVDAECEPVPAIFEYLPYRKRDGTAARDAINNPYLAGHGYACVRVDIRGNGESEGLMADEYSEQEQLDGVEVIDWIAAQPWCSGRVAMMGISWGGFNGLQIAARRPPALATVITLASTDDRYDADIHYFGGCVLGDNLGWGAVMLGLTSRPPDPALVGERWRELWRARLRHMPFLAAIWLSHQRRDAYWRQGSICEDYAAVGIPVLAIDGWADAYVNPVGRMVTNLPGPTKAILGPWAHRYPHFARPEPTIGFLQEALRWFDRWLKDADSGVEADPAVRAYMTESQPPEPDFGPRRGRWIATSAWPPPESEPRAYALDAGGALSEQPGRDADVQVCSPQDTGLAAGRFMPLGFGATGPGDQRGDDAKSVCFETAPLDHRLELFGTPELELELASDAPQAAVVVRLCDVDGDGASRRVTWGALNLSHRHGRAEPQQLVPGERVRVRVRLNDCAHAFLPGQRVRVAVSTVYWPTLWPAPTPVTLTLRTGASRLWLPVRPAGDGPEWEFPEAEGAPLQTVDYRDGDCEVLIEERGADGMTRVTYRDDYGAKLFKAHGLEFDAWGEETLTVAPDDPLSARAETYHAHELGRGSWQVRTESWTEMRCDAANFYLTAALKAWEGGELVEDLSWSETIPRDHQ